MNHYYFIYNKKTDESIEQGQGFLPIHIGDIVKDTGGRDYKVTSVLWVFENRGEGYSTSLQQTISVIPKKGRRL